MGRNRLPIMAAIAAGMSLVAGGFALSGSFDHPVPVGAGEDWPSVGGGADESFYSQLDQIDTDTVDELGLAWSLDLPGEVTLEATPVEVGGTLYFTGTLAKVYAVNAKTGALKWTYDPQVWKHSPEKMHLSFGANRGVAYEDGKVFAAALDGRLFALDAKTGKELWIVQTLPRGTYHTSTGAPRTMNGKVIIGNGGADGGARGFVTAYDAASGKQLWRFYTVPGPPEENRGNPAMEAAALTWSGEWWKGGTGGTVWNGMTFDAELDRVYIGVGNAAFDAGRRNPEGRDNLYTASIIALDARTGQYIWHYQQNPNDAWDYKATANIVLASVKFGDGEHKVLMQAPTNGFFYVLDRETGKLLNEPGKTTEISWAERIDRKTGRPVEKPNIRYETGETKIWPGAVGGHNWQAMAFSPRTGLAYIPIQQLGTRFSRGPNSENGFNFMGLSYEPVVEREGDGHGYLVAWNPVSQKEIWRVQHRGLWNGGALATAGNLVFQGTADGFFRAYDARDGKEVWSFDAGLGIVAPPMSYNIEGRQYVSILVGYGGTSAAYGGFMDMGYKYGRQPRRLLTFTLGGSGTLPSKSPPDFVVHALDDPALQLSEADIAAGHVLSVQCAFCHGVGMQATGTPGPDLRESAIAVDLKSFSAVLKSGALIERGMPRFDHLTDGQIRELHAYIRAKAREALGNRPRDNTIPAFGRL